MDIFGDDFGGTPAPQSLVSSGDSVLSSTNLDDFGGLGSPALSQNQNAPILSSPGESNTLFDSSEDSIGGELFSSDMNQGPGSGSLLSGSESLIGGTVDKEDVITNSLENSAKEILKKNFTNLERDITS